MRYILRNKVTNTYYKRGSYGGSFVPDITKAHVFGNKNGAVQGAGPLGWNAQCTCPVILLERRRYRKRHSRLCAVTIAKQAEFAEKFELIPVDITKLIHEAKDGGLF